MANTPARSMLNMIIEMPPQLKKAITEDQLVTIITQVFAEDLGAFAKDLKQLTPFGIMKVSSLLGLFLIDYIDKATKQMVETKKSKGEQSMYAVADKILKDMENE